MKDKSRITVRVPSWVKEEMDKKNEINWSQIIRNILIEYIKIEDFPLHFRRIVKKHKLSENWDLLKAFYLFSANDDKKSLRSNLYTVFDERADEIENDLKKTLIDLGIQYKVEIPKEQNIKENILNILFEEGVISDLEGEIDRLFEHVEIKSKINEAIWYLGLYLKDESDFEPNSVSFAGDGLNIYFSHLFDDPEKIINELIKIGVLSQSNYRSNAYSYTIYRLLDQSIKLVKEIQLNPEKYSLTHLDLSQNIEDLLHHERNRFLIKSLDQGLDVHNRYNNTIQDFEEKFGEGSFNDTLDELVKKGIIICNYSPSRKRSGKRGAMRSSLYYKLSKTGEEKLKEYILNRHLQNKEGKVQSIIELYEL
ncbi:hypothetical protein DSAG12_02648 [Promethearchaeum syntrophicum]|uniref:Uncharacterized protein n=1 Tax=Promethearchaeum syntrophicum TaxID=2594042 RepID=A0A5B9DC73_9ARCH|nr:hypothetical protein [Candidatus Prometheoarchaeum syntrophicum]QEE16818.1 hypothetical protein DSAG12_02648 [Candidatus Prometheoarchaeum syntrophicum]